MDDRIVIGGDISLRNIIDGDMRLSNQIDGQAQPVMVHNAGTYDHNKLFNRDANDQHPIDAISNLDGELNIRPSERISNFDILSIMNT